MVKIITEGVSRDTEALLVFNYFRYKRGFTFIIVLFFFCVLRLVSVDLGSRLLFGENPRARVNCILL